MELALRVDIVETVVPKQYPDLYKPNDYRLRPDPARRAVNARLGMGGLEPTKRATDPRVVLP